MKKPMAVGDTEQVIAFLEWAQVNGVSASSVTVGGCHVELLPVRGHEASAERSDEDSRASIYKQFGGPALDYAVAEEVLGEDLQPVVGRKS